ncbi:hypothetical protein KC19_1G218900 [Ceratodon purpureus]|uniref:PPM-type phosphatase domain-containing protein n=1 Tax=Ceratodon purpureus TaxID=3225 RepID=A0A8T0J8L7_CERPU|nr:hypothetical protein KC19_1G218900 [Ceratodon purpureus]
MVSLYCKASVVIPWKTFISQSFAISMARRYQSTSFQTVCVLPHDSIKALELGYRQLKTGLFGIIDSHGGPAVGKHVQHHLFNNILSEGGVHLDPAGATRDGYLLTDRNVLESSLEGGCSAVTAMLVDHGSRLIVANVGDARAVLAKNGRAVQLSVDHDPGSPTERASVERRGGMVTQIPGDYWRVDGLLSVARAFGDKSLKEHMSARPDLADHVVDLSCEFLILGSNGLWAVFTNQEIVDIVHKIKDPTKAAQELVSEARNRHSEDDISCLVIQFREL